MVRALPHESRILVEKTQIATPIDQTRAARV
jgi:hypothetical protein